MKLRYLIPLICFIMGALLIPASAGAAPLAQDQPNDSRLISGAPLQIYVGSNGSIQVYHQNYTHGATFGSGDSGFFIALGSAVYGPDLYATNPSSAAAMTINQMTLISHDGPTGSGSRSDPYRITTVHSLNGSG